MQYMLPDDIRFLPSPEMRFLILRAWLESESKAISAQAEPAPVLYLPRAHEHSELIIASRDDAKESRRE